MDSSKGGTPAQQAAYQAFAAKLPVAGLGSLKGFAADNQLVVTTTALSNQAMFLTDPYEYYLSVKIQAEQNNLNAQAGKSNLDNSTTATNSSNYAIAQMAALRQSDRSLSIALIQSNGSISLRCSDGSASCAANRHIYPPSSATTPNSEVSAGPPPVTQEQLPTQLQNGAYMSAGTQ